MKRTFTAALLATALALMALTPTAVSASELATIDVEFRAAPAGFVVPSFFVVNNEGEWIVDPAKDNTFNDAPGFAGCDLTVEDRNGDGAFDGVDVLKTAEEIGCIDGWEARNQGTIPYLGSDRAEDCSEGDIIVAEIDGLKEVWPATFWIVHRNGGTANTGVCGMALEDGDSLSFVYE